MCAIAAMLFLALAELVMQLVVTSFAMRLLFSAGTQGIETASFLKQQASLEYLYNMIVFVEDLILVTNKFAYRCYLIWGPEYNKQVVSLPVLLLLVTTALGYVTVYANDITDPGAHIFDSRIGFVFAIVTNLVLTGLTAGRIWWTRRELQIVGQGKFTQRYTNAISVLLESGAAYCLFLIFVILALTFGRKANSGPTATFASFAYGAAGQLVNIVPTIFIVRMGLFTTPPLESQKVDKFVV
ncbi:hypothetical protein B0H12DRAFT_1308171 [Mycena haematopus]|nr:hypothetical protein B0H12DRAFT_1308171 [Mycena haematopus]